MRKKNYQMLLYYLSTFIIMIGFIQLVPLLVIPFYLEEAYLIPCFLLPGIISIIFGYLLHKRMENIEIQRLGRYYDSILVVSIWLLAILISTVPWMMTGEYNFSQAMFEMTSGFSTTGLSVVDADTCPKVFLMFRSIVLFFGGVGLVLILAAAMNDRYALNIYNAEGHNDKLMPNLKATAKLILGIYALYIVIGIIAYIFFGMPVFDAINTAIAALSTGGFAVKTDSIYAYDSLPIEIITIILMLLGQTNFVIHYFFFKRKFKNIWKNCETKFFLCVLLIGMPIMVISLLKSGYCANFFEALRVGSFNFVTCITTTGFISVKDLSVLPLPVFNLMTFLMLIGGNLESTGGGIKQYRVIVTLKGIYYSIRDAIKPEKVVRTNYIERLGKKKVLSDDEISSTTTYVMFYLILFFIGSYIFSCFGYSLQESMFEFASALSTVGLSVGITGYSANNIILWTGIVGMFFGRLEIMVIFEALIKIIKDAKGKAY